MSNSNESQETKQCPFCGETILAVARKCRYCGEMLDGASPQQAPPQPPVYTGPQPPVYTPPQPPLPPCFSPQGVPYPEQILRDIDAPKYKPESFLKFRNWIFRGMLLTIACLVAAPISYAIAVEISGWNQHLSDPFVGFFLISSCVLAALSLIAFCIFHYRCWKIIQDGYARTTPGSAIGFLFLPFFNFYWIFVSFYGLAIDMNNYLKRYDIKEKRCCHEIAMTWCVFNLIFPFGSPIIAIFYLITISRVAAAIQKANLEKRH